MASTYYNSLTVKFIQTSEIVIKVVLQDILSRAYRKRGHATPTVIAQTVKVLSHHVSLQVLCIVHKCMLYASHAVLYYKPSGHIL